MPKGLLRKKGVAGLGMACSKKGALLAAVAAATLSVRSGFAATETWVGGTTLWSTSGNWSGTNLPPASGDSLTFGAAGAGGTSLTDDLTTSAFSLGTISFNTSASAYVIGGNAFAMTGGTITNSSTTAAQTINDNIFEANGITLTGGAGLTLGGAVIGTSNANINQFLFNAGVYNLTGSWGNVYFAINNGSNVTSSGIGTNFANGTANSANIVLQGTGTYNITGGYVGTNGFTAIGNGAGNGSTMNVTGGLYEMGNGQFQLGQAGSSNGTLNINGNGIVRIYPGVSTFDDGGAAAGTINLGNGATGGEFDIGAAIAANFAGSAFNFNGGLLRLLVSPGNLLSSATNVATKVGNGGANIDLNSFSTTILSPLLTNGTGGLTVTSTQGGGALTLTGANTFTGTVTIGGGATLNVGASVGANSLNGTVGMPLTFSSSGSINFFEATTGAAQAMGALTINSGAVSVASTYGTSGTTSLTFASMSAIPSTSTVNFTASGGTNGTTNSIIVTGATPGIAGVNQFFNGTLATANYLVFDATTVGLARGINYSGGEVGQASTVAGGASLTSIAYAQTTGAVTAQATATFTGLNIVNTTNVAQAFTLASGATVTTQGILRSGAGGTTGITTISGGTGIAFGSSPLVIYTATANDLLTISTPIITGTGGVVKSGLGTLTLGGTDTFTGTLTINQGTLAATSQAALTTNNIALNGGALSAPFSLTNTITLGGVGGVISGNSIIPSANQFNGSGPLVVTATGAGLTINAPQNYTGGTYIPAAGRISLGDPGGLGAGDVHVGSTGQLILTGTGTITNNFYIAGTTAAEAIRDTGLMTLGTSPNSSTIYLQSANAQITADQAGGTFTINDAIYGPFAVVLNGGATGTATSVVNLRGTANEFNGIVYNGIVNFTADTNLGPPLAGDTLTANTGGGTLQAGANNITMSSGRVISLTATAGTTIDTQAFTLTDLGAITGAQPITKIGTGTLNLGGASTNTGATNVTAGLLDVISGGSLTGAQVAISGAGTMRVEAGGTLAATTTVTINSGGTFFLPTGVSLANATAFTVNNGGIMKVAPGVASGTGTLAGSLTLNTGGVLSMVDGFANTFNLASTSGPASGAVGTIDMEVGTGSTSDLIHFTGATTTIGGVGEAILISTLPGTTTLGSSYTLMTATTGLATAPLSLTSNKIVVNGTTYSLSLNRTASAVTLVVGADTLDQAYWTGKGGSTWASVNGAQTNWSTSVTGSPDAGAQPNSATDVFFTASTVTAPFTTTLGTAYSINSLNYTAAAPAITIAADGNTLSIANGISIASGAGAQTISAPIALTGGQTWTNASAGTTFTVAAVSGNGNVLNLAGAGNITIGGAITGGGALNTSASGNIVVNGAVTAGNMGLIANGNITFNSAVGGGNIAISGAGNTTFNAAVTGGTFTNSGTGTVTLAATSTLTGVTTNSGTLVLAGGDGTNGTLSNTAASALVNTGVLQLQATSANTAAGVSTAMTSAANSNTTLTTTGSSMTIQLRGDNNVTFASGGTPGGTGTAGNGSIGGVNSSTGYTLNFDVNRLTSAGGNNVFSFATNNGIQIGQNVTINVTGGNGDSLSLGNLSYTPATAGTVTLNPTTASLSVGGLLSISTSAAKLTLAGSAGTNNFVTGIIANSTGTGTPVTTITESGAGAWTLGGANTFGSTVTTASATSVVQTAGTLNLSNTSALGITGGTLSINGASSLQLLTDTGFGAKTYNIDYGNSSSTIGAFTSTLAMGRATAGASNSITQQFGTLTIAGDGGKSIAINVTAGPNASSSLDTLAFTGLLTGNGNTVTHTLNPTGANITIGTVGNITGTSAATTLDFDGTTQGNVITGIIGGTTPANIAIIKSNSSTWTFNGVGNTYTGPTSVTGGTLALGNGTTLANTAVAVSGGTFAVRPGLNGGATGAVNSLGGTLAFTGGSTFSMVDGITSTFNVTGATSFGAASTLQFEVGGATSDVINVTGAATNATGPQYITISGIGTALTQTSYPLINSVAGGLTNANFALTSTRVLVNGVAYNLGLTGTSNGESLTVSQQAAAAAVYFYGGGSPGNDATPGTYFSLNEVSGDGKFATNFSTDPNGTYGTNGANDFGGGVDNQPGAGQDVYFTGANLNGSPQTISSLGQAYVFNSLNFTAGSGLITINNGGSGSTLTVNGGGVTVASGAGGAVINVPYVAGGLQTITNNSTNLLSFTDGFAAGAFNLTFTGSGPTTIGPTGTLSITTATNLTVTSGAGPVTISAAFPVTSNFSLINNSAHVLTMGAITIGTNTLTVNGTGVGGTTFAGNFTGTTSTTLTVSGPGPVKFTGAANTLEILNLNTTTPLDIGSGTFNFLNNAGVGGLVSTTGGTINATGGGTLAFAQNNAGDGANSGTASGTTLTINAKLVNGTGQASSAFEQYDGSGNTGVVVLTAANTFSGNYLLNSGTVSVSSIGNFPNPGNLGEGSQLVFANNNVDTLLYTGIGEVTNHQLNLGGTTNATIDQSGTGTLEFNGTSVVPAAGAKTWTFQGSTAGNGQIDFALVNGASSAAISVIKTGTGMWTFTGSGTSANTYTGTTTVTQGVLNITGTLGNTAVTVAASATLGGSGTIGLGATPAVVINGILRPGDLRVSPATGLMTVTGALTFPVSTSTFSPRLGGTAASGTTVAVAGSDFTQLVISPTGTITLGGTAVFTPIVSTTPNSQATYVLIDNQSTTETASAVGTFAGLSQGAGVTVGGVPFTITYTYDADTGGGNVTTGNDVALLPTSVPEPATLSLLALGAAGLLARRRRRA